MIKLMTNSTLHIYLHVYLLCNEWWI